MKKITKYFIIIFSITFCGNINAKSKKKELLSYNPFLKDDDNFS